MMRRAPVPASVDGIVMTRFGFLMLLLVPGLLASCGTRPEPDPDPGSTRVVTPAWVASRLPLLVVVDARDRALFEGGHVPGAVHLPSGEILDDVEPDRFASSARLGEVFANAGLHPDDRVLLCGSWSEVAALFWAFDAHGHRDVRIMEGGFERWASEARPVVRGRSLPPAGRYLARRTPCDLDEFRQAMGRATIVDCRSEREYLGYETEGDRYGHVEGAVHVEIESLFVEQDGHRVLASRAELERLFADIGPEAVLYANHPAEATIVYAALRRLDRRVSIVEQPWSAIAADRRIPVAAAAWSGADDFE